jgi:ABC-type antimicrobial peptide transport system permease subunit
MAKSDSGLGPLSFLLVGLTIAFVVLKLLEKIDWSWWWVLSPLWIPLAFVIVVIIFLGILAFIYKTL